jgi:putative ABC transport system substrate-binding protein
LTVGSSNPRFFDAAAAAWPLAAQAQRPTKVARIGFVGANAADSIPKQVEAFRAGLSELGYQEVRDIVIEFRRSSTNWLAAISM